MDSDDSIGDVESGMVLWLPEAAPKSCKKAFRKSGIAQEAVGRPVLVLDDLGGKHEYVWILLLTTKYRSWRGDLLLASTVDQCKECGMSHSSAHSQVLTFVNDMPMKRASHVQIKDVIEVPLSMLEEFRDGGEYHLQLDDSSLQSLRHKVPRKSFETAHGRIRHWPQPDSMEPAAASALQIRYSFPLPENAAEAKTMFTPVAWDGRAKRQGRAVKPVEPMAETHGPVPA